MQLRRKIKRLAALVLAMSMALGCMPVGAWAEATTPTDLPPIIATDGEAVPEPALPSDEQDAEKTDDAPASEDSEVPDESHGDSEPAADDPASEQEESADDNADDMPADNPQGDDAQDAIPDEPADGSEEENEDNTPDGETVPDNRLPIQAALDEYGHVYVATVHKAVVYSNAAMTEESLVYTTTEDVFLVLATEFVAPASVKVWFLNETGEVICGYVRADDLDSSYLLDEDIPQISFFPAGEGMTDIGLMPLFIVSGEQPTTDAEGDPAEMQEDAVPDEQQPDTETPDDAAGLQPEHGELGDADEQLPVTDMEEILPPEENADAPVLVAPGDYVSVTTDTRVLEYVNEYGIEDYYCDGYLGQFVNDATVQVLSITTDELGNGWYEVRFLYGDDFADGTMKWTDYATCWVMAAETGPANSDACTVTDFAYSQEFLEALQAMDINLYATAMNGFSLKNINGSVGGFYAWQSSLYGSSGRDSAYPQIAKSASHGTIYATPHYLEGYTVYCLEHNLSGPGEGSGSNQTAKGPYVLVDMDYFVNNSVGGGVSGVRFSAKTMHALAWVLRHTYLNPTTLLATVINEDAPGRIRITKQDALDQHTIAGVQFDIYSVDEDGNAMDRVAHIITNDQGIAESPDLFPTDYIVREHANPTGYEDTLWSEKITVGMDELVTRTVTNMPIQGVIRIVKTDSETANGLPGAEFTVTRISGLPSHNGEGDGEVVAVITTDENGIAQTPLLTWGEYEIVETVVPDDYLDDGYSTTVRIPAEAEPQPASLEE